MVHKRIIFKASCSDRNVLYFEFITVSFLVVNFHYSSVRIYPWGKLAEGQRVLSVLFIIFVYEYAFVSKEIF